AHSGRASEAEMSVGRLSTMPTAPSASWSSSKITVRAKLGSSSAGEATSSAPVKQASTIGPSWRTRPPLGQDLAIFATRSAALGEGRVLADVETGRCPRGYPAGNVHRRPAGSIEGIRHGRRPRADVTDTDDGAICRQFAHPVAELAHRDVHRP